MKIVGICGSPHRKGYSGAMMEKALEGARDSGIETEAIYLKDYTIDYCEGCMKCMEVGQCVIKDDFLKLKEKLTESDGILFTSPTYGEAPTARMKNFMTDRLGMYSVYTSEFRDKYFGAIATAGAIGAEKNAKHMANAFSTGFFGNGYVSGYLGINIADNFEMKDLDKMDVEGSRSYELGQKMAADILNHRQYPMQNLFQKIMLKQVVSNIIMKNILKNKEGTMKAVYERLIRFGDIA